MALAISGCEQSSKDQRENATKPGESKHQTASGADKLISQTRPAAQTKPGGKPVVVRVPASAPAAHAVGNIWGYSDPYIVHRAAGQITIDGNDHPEEWANAMVIENFLIPITYEKPKRTTQAKMLWDDQNLYVWFIAYDTDLRGTLKGKLARVWTEDAVELFLSPVFEKGSYYELELGPSNVLLALQIENTKRGSFQERANWDHHIKTAVGVEGTINNPDDIDKYYRGVMAIPFTDLKFAGNKAPAISDTWRFNIPRCDLSKEFGDQQELSACVPLPKIDFHISDNYGRMRFEK